MLNPNTITNNRNILFGEDAQYKLIQGINQVADAVKVTMGPSGKNVIIEDVYGSPVITKDGVTVAKSISLTDPVENLGASLVKDVALRSNKVSGDGTTTATVLAQSLVNKGFEYLREDSSINPYEFRKGMETACEEVVKHLRKMSKKASKKTVEQVASVSSNGDKDIVELVAKAYSTQSEDTVVTIEKSKTTESHVEFTQGFKISNFGFLSPHFVTDQTRNICEMPEALVFVYNENVKDFNKVIPVIEYAMQENKPILFIARSFSQEVTNIIALNAVKGDLNLCCVDLSNYSKAKNHDYVLEDLVSLTGGLLYTQELDGAITDINLSDFMGYVERIEVGKDETKFVSGRADIVVVDDVLTRSKKSIEDQTDEDSDFYNDLKDRISRLSGSISAIKIGGKTEIEIGERYDRVEDAVNAVKAALKEGVVVGGGAALIHAFNRCKGANLNTTDCFVKGEETVYHACFEPFDQILKNAEMYKNGADDVSLNLPYDNKNIGYNISTGEFEDLVKLGIVDPVLVTINSLESAVSIATLILTTEALMTFERKETTK